MIFDFFRKRSDIHKRIDNLHSHLSDSFSKIKEDMGKISSWINHFDSKTKYHDHKISFILKKIELIEDLLENMRQNEGKVIDEERAIERIQSFNRSNQSFMNVQSLKNLTPAQKQILALLGYAGGPLGYDDMSKKLGLNVITVRRHLNDIKRSGIKIDEKVSVKGRKKVFLLDKRIKKIVLKQKVRVENN